MTSNISINSFELQIRASLFGILHIKDISYFDCALTMERNIEITVNENILKFSLSIHECSTENIIKTFKRTFPEYFL